MWVAVVFSLIGYFLIKQTAIGPARYALPLSPLYFLAFAYAIQEVERSKKWRKVGLLVFGVLGSLHIATQLWVRGEYAHSGEQVLREREQVVQCFAEAARSGKITVVVADDYWEANTYTVMTGGKPYFISTGRELGPREPFEKFAHEKFVGVILVQSPVQSHQTIVLRGVTWKLGAFTRVGNRNLTIAERAI